MVVYSGEGMDFSGKTILLVEDESIIAHQETVWLKKEGCNVIHVSNGIDAISKVNENPAEIDLILMDINLGTGMDGTEAASVILSKHDIPLLFLSSHTDQGIVQLTEEITSYGYVVKGSTNTVLLASIKMAFKLHKANTELKLANSAIKQSEAKLRAMFDCSLTAIGVSSNEIHAFSNPAYLKLFGYESDDELIGTPIIICIAENERERVLDIARKRTSGEQVQTFYETRGRRKDGTEFDMEINVATYRLNGKTYTVGNIHEITERKKHEEEILKLNAKLEDRVIERTKQLAETNQLLEEEVVKLKLAEESIRDQLSFVETILQTVPIPIYIKDFQGKYVNCNQLFEEINGLTRNAIIGNTMMRLKNIIDSELHSQMDEEVLKNRKVITYHSQYVNAQNIVRDAIFCKAPLIKSDGQIMGTIGVIQDITESKTLEKKIQNSLETERKLNELKTRFISNSSHEFRTPLTAILSSADLLEIYGRNWTEEKFNKHTMQIRRSVKYMTELLDDILEISRMDRGKVTFNPTKLNLPYACREVIEIIKVRAGEKQELCFSYNCEKNIFMLDEKLIKHILTNLLSNAVKFSPDGGRIELKISLKNEVLLLEVSDQGIGIPEDELKNLTEPFFRARNAAHIPGTGLGLSIVKKSVEMHGGTLYFESRLEEGSAFFVTIPVY